MVPQPKAIFKFPLGEVAFEEREEEEEEQKRALSVNGIFKTHTLDGVLTAKYNEENLDLRYAFKVFYLEWQCYWNAIMIASITECVFQKI